MKHLRGRRIGLLGGSFNPAHSGHRHISLMALQRLDLDEVWWLVSPQNPLKTADGMAALDVRLKQARRVARHPRIRVTDIERRLGTRYTRDTVVALQRRFPADRFVWLMGADNLAQLPRWVRWEDLVQQIPVAVFDRAPHSSRIMSGQAATRFRHALIRQHQARDLWRQCPPALTYIRMRRHALSATAIRNGTMKDETTTNDTTPNDTGLA
ncbi:MAG: nicotinate-nucleotide adenylyltransferase [Minwuia sp.]|nr:nicotinate-nucleotide adenylyltransferase [Minwuia sp.]